MAPAWPPRWPGWTEPVARDPRRPLTARPRRVRELVRPQARVPLWRHRWRGRWLQARHWLALDLHRLPPVLQTEVGRQRWVLRRLLRRLLRRGWPLLDLPTSRH